GAIWIILERGFQVALIDGHAACDGLLHVGADHFHAAAVDLLVLLQPGEQFSGAAAEIEHTRAGFHQIADDGVIATPVDVTNAQECSSLNSSWSSSGRLPERAG